MQAATKVGILVVAFVVLLYGAYAILGRALFAPERAKYFADFSDASGIAQGSQVLMAGLEIGNVSEAKLLGPTRARLTLEIKPDVKIPAKSEAIIPGSLLALTQGTILIMPPAKPSGAYAAEGTVLKGRRASAVESAVPGAGDAVAELTKTIKATRELIEDDALRKDIKDLLKSTNATMKQFGTLSASTQGLITQNRALLNEALRNATAAMKDIQEGTGMLVATMKEGKFGEKTSQMLDRLNSASAKAEHLVASLDNLFSDENTQSSIKTTLNNAATISENTAKISESGTRIAESAEVIAKNGEEVSASAVEIAKKANELATEAKSTLSDIRGFFGKAKGGTPLNFTGSMDVLRQDDPEYWRQDLMFSTKFKDTSYHIGMFDAFESNKLIIQLGQDAGNGLHYRYGIFAAKPGVGVDYRFNDRLSLRGDLFDLNDPRLDLKFRVGLGKGVYGWIGQDRILQHGRPTVGIGIQK